MKACLLTTNSNTKTPGANDQAVIQQLKGAGIDFRRRTANSETATSLMAGGFDFIIIPSIYDGEFTTIINDNILTIPIFVMGYVPASTTFYLGNTPGVTGAQSGAVERFFSSPFSSSIWTCVWARFFALSGGTSIMTCRATDSNSDGAQAESGQTCFWHTPRGTGQVAGRLYIHLCISDNYPMLAFMLQAAYNVGDFTNNQMSSLRKLPVVIDLDHINGSTAGNDGFRDSSTYLNRWLNLIPARGVSWCGTFNTHAQPGPSQPPPGFDITKEPDYSGIDADVIAIIQAEHNKRLRYCYHNHGVSVRLICPTGTYPNLTNTQTKQQQADNYACDDGLWNSVTGFVQDVGYYNPGINAWNEEMAALLSPDKSLASSGGNTTSIAGKGFKVLRNSYSNQCSRPATLMEAGSVHNLHTQREYVRGMTLQQSLELTLETTGASTSLWAIKFEYVCLAIHYGVAMYMHDSAFIDTQNPKTSRFGVEMMYILNDYGRYLNKVASFFADPLEYALERTVSL